MRSSVSRYFLEGEEEKDERHGNANAKPAAPPPLTLLRKSSLLSLSRSYPSKQIFVFPSSLQQKISLFIRAILPLLLRDT
jgi:hypothetical protein